MSDVVAARDLSGFHTFAAYSPEELSVLTSILDGHTFEDGEEICEQGEEGDSCFILLSGAVGVERDIAGAGKRRLGSLIPGAIFGQLSLIDGKPRMATCKSVGVSRVAELDRVAFLQLCQEGSRFAIKFQIEAARALIRQLRQSNQTLSEVEGAEDPAEESNTLTNWLDDLMNDSHNPL